MSRVRRASTFRLAPPAMACSPHARGHQVVLQKPLVRQSSRNLNSLGPIANVMLTRYKGQLKLKDWAFAIARRSTMRKARIALARRLAIIMHAMLRDGTEFLAA